MRCRELAPTVHTAGQGRKALGAVESGGEGCVRAPAAGGRNGSYGFRYLAENRCTEFLSLVEGGPNGEVAPGQSVPASNQNWDANGSEQGLGATRRVQKVLKRQLQFRSTATIPDSGD